MSSLLPTVAMLLWTSLPPGGPVATRAGGPLQTRLLHPSSPEQAPTLWSHPDERGAWLPWWNSCSLAPASMRAQWETQLKASELPETTRKMAGFPLMGSLLFVTPPNRPPLFAPIASERACAAPDHRQAEAAGRRRRVDPRFGAATIRRVHERRGTGPAREGDRSGREQMDWRAVAAMLK